jgi:hypothetical protein
MFKFAILMLETIYWLLEKIKVGDNIYVTGERNFRVLFVRVKNLFYTKKQDLQQSTCLLYVFGWNL